MATKPLESILYRELSILRADDVNEVASPLLTELVNHATNALARCATSGPTKFDEDIAPLALYRHVIEMADGIEVLLSNACSVPAIPALRSLFEALLSIEYIVEGESSYTRRSLAWLVGYAYQRQGMYQLLDPNSPRGMEFKRFIENDATLSRMTLPDPGEAHDAIANLDSFLDKPHIRPIRAEYSKHRRRPNWYHLFDGPQNLRELAKHLNKGAYYEILYRKWSRTVHSQDLLPFLHSTPQRNAAIGPLRKPEDVREVASFTASSILAATRMIIGKFRPGEDLGPWYVREIHQKYLTITGASSQP